MYRGISELSCALRAEEVREPYARIFYVICAGAFGALAKSILAPGVATTKRLGLLHEMVPKVDVIGVLVNPDYGAIDAQLQDVREAASRLGLQLVTPMWRVNLKRRSRR